MDNINIVLFYVDSQHLNQLTDPSAIKDHYETMKDSYFGGLRNELDAAVGDRKKELDTLLKELPAKMGDYDGTTTPAKCKEICALVCECVFATLKQNVKDPKLYLRFFALATTAAHKFNFSLQNVINEKFIHECINETLEPFRQEWEPAEGSEYIKMWRLPTPKTPPTGNKVTRGVAVDVTIPGGDIERLMNLVNLMRYEFKERLKHDSGMKAKELQRFNPLTCTILLESTKMGYLFSKFLGTEACYTTFKYTSDLNQTTKEYYGFDIAISVDPTVYKNGGVKQPAKKDGDNNNRSPESDNNNTPGATIGSPSPNKKKKDERETNTLSDKELKKRELKEKNLNMCLLKIWVDKENNLRMIRQMIFHLPKKIENILTPEACCKREKKVMLSMLAPLFPKKGTEVQRKRSSSKSNPPKNL